MEEKSKREIKDIANPLHQDYDPLPIWNIRILSRLFKEDFPCKVMVKMKKGDTFFGRSFKQKWEMENMEKIREGDTTTLLVRKNSFVGVKILVSGSFPSVKTYIPAVEHSPYGSTFYFLPRFFSSLFISLFSILFYIPRLRFKTKVFNFLRYDGLRDCDIRDK